MQCTQYIAIKLFFATRLLRHFAWYIGFGARGVGGGEGEEEGKGYSQKNWVERAARFLKPSSPSGGIKKPDNPTPSQSARTGYLA